MGEASIGFEHSRILAVDDDLEIQELYQTTFSSSGDNASSATEQLLNLVTGVENSDQSASQHTPYNCSVVDQGERAVALAENALAEGKPYTVAFLDMRMPLRKPFVREEILQKARMLSRNWGKDRQRLQETLAEFLTACSRDGKVVAESENTDSASSTGAGGFLDDELMQLFVDRTRILRAELVAALDQSDWNAVRNSAHTVKGSGTTFGFPLLTSLGKEVCDLVDHDQLDKVPELTRQLVDEMRKALPDDA